MHCGNSVGGQVNHARESNASFDLPVKTNRLLRAKSFRVI